MIPLSFTRAQLLSRTFKIIKMDKKDNAPATTDSEDKSILQQAADLMSNIGSRIVDAKDTVVDFVADEAIVVKKAAKKIARKVKKAVKKAPVKKAANKLVKKAAPKKKAAKKTIRKAVKRIASKAPSKKSVKKAVKKIAKKAAPKNKKR
jgi:hypothetical protein